MTERRRLLELDEASLEAECEVDRFRASGPGGQKRNKTESAIRVRHRGTGVAAFCDENRSQHANRQEAVRRLREKIALEVREMIQPSAPPELVALMANYRQSKRERGSTEYLLGLAQLLDVFVACDCAIAELGDALGISTSAASRLIAADERVFRAANELRAGRGLKALR